MLCSLAVVTRYPDYRSQMGNDLAVLSQQRGYRYIQQHTNSGHCIGSLPA